MSGDRGSARRLLELLQALGCCLRPHSFHPLATQKGAEISRCIDDSKNLYSAWMRMIKDEHFLEAGYPEDSQGSKFGMFEPGMPPHLWICGK